MYVYTILILLTAKHITLFYAFAYTSSHFQFALRWRTESEVLSGAGERSCSNTRCPLHTPPLDEEDRIPGLATLELPFAYEERGEKKSALVKVVLCARCVRKLMWKREREKAAARDPNLAFGPTAPTAETTNELSQGQPRQTEELRHERDGRANKEGRRERHSRSRSPRERSKHRDRRRRPQSP
jgi:protein FRA10AC1